MDDDIPADTRATELLSLTADRFGECWLNDAECKVFWNAVEGRESDFKDQPDEARTMRANRVVWLLTDQDAKARLSHRGIRIVNAIVDGPLDLSGIDFHADLEFLYCRIPEGIGLADARIRGLYLSGTEVSRLNADRLETRGSVFLKHGFCATRGARLVNAKIGITLDCRGGRFINESPNLGEHALHLDGINVCGDVSLSENFYAKGRVRLLGATIGGDLACSGRTFETGNDIALSAYRATISGNVFLREGFTATSEVRFVYASIGGEFNCSGGRFLGSGTSLHLEGASIAGKLWLTFREKPAGLINLESASTLLLIDDPEMWPKRINLLGFLYERFDGKVDQSVERRLDWLSRGHLLGGRSRRLRFNPEPYEQLATVYRKAGRLDDARRVLIEKEKKLGQEFEQWWRRFLWRLWGWLAGYGYQTSRTFIIGIVIVLLTTAVFYWGHGPACGGPAIVPPNRFAHVDEATLVNQNTAASYPAFNAFVYAADVFVPLIDLEQTKYWQPMWNRGLKGAR